MPWFCKEPYPVEAFQLAQNNVDEVAEWCGATVAYDTETEAAYLNISTLEGTMRADIGYWIIKGVQGEFYPCRADIFSQTYRSA